jgi:hypothetical protein
LSLLAVLPSTWYCIVGERYSWIFPSCLRWSEAAVARQNLPDVTDSVVKLRLIRAARSARRTVIEIIRRTMRAVRENVSALPEGSAIM